MPRRFALALALALLAAPACRDQGITQLEGVRDEICHCTTSKCGEDAMKRVPDIDAPHTHRAQTIARDMMDCLAKLYDAEKSGAGSGDDDSPRSTGTADNPSPGTPAPEPGGSASSGGGSASSAGGGGSASRAGSGGGSASSAGSGGGSASSAGSGS